MGKKIYNYPYGMVLIIKGSQKGKIGYYDDDDGNQGIVYFGRMLLGGQYQLIHRNWFVPLQPLFENDIILDALDFAHRNHGDSPHNPDWEMKNLGTVEESDFSGEEND